MANYVCMCIKLNKGINHQGIKEHLKLEFYIKEAKEFFFYIIKKKNYKKEKYNKQNIYIENHMRNIKSF